jgi:hypothetical protein
MKTITSISGGKTSAYLAKHYPTDENIFALIRIEDRRCTPKDKTLVQKISDKIGTEFIATAESDTTLTLMFDLEQLLGKEIIWVTGDTFEQVCLKRKALPNLMMRFCTTEMKMKPIFDFCHNHFGIVEMNIGFRYDEKERANSQNTKFKTITGQSANGRNKWTEIEWRTCKYPLIENRIGHYQVAQWANKTDLIFPPDSNCVGCFWKNPQQLRKNFDDESLKMQWFADMETTLKRKWKKEMSYEKIKTIGLQQDFYFGTGSGCQAGFCTD